MSFGTRPGRAERLRRLAVNGHAAQWSIDRAIDWSLQHRLPRWLPPSEAAQVISQLFHGEVATGRLCRRLRDQVVEPEAHACLGIQIADEARHAAVYARYLARLGGVMPVEPALGSVLEEGLAWRGSPLAPVVLFHVVVEGEALRLLDAFIRALPCPLLGQINRRISRDEARHVAFGRIYLAERLAALPADERRAIARWVRALWAGYAGAAPGGTTRRDRVIRRLLSNWLDLGWRRHSASLAEIGLPSGSLGGLPAQEDRP